MPVRPHGQRFLSAVARPTSPRPTTPLLAQAERHDGASGWIRARRVNGEGVQGERVRPTADLRVQGEQEGGLLRETQVKPENVFLLSRTCVWMCVYARGRAPFSNVEPLFCGMQFGCVW